MILTLDENHKKNLQFLMTQPIDILEEFCKFVVEYLYKGQDPKQSPFQAAAQKVGTAPDVIRGAIEGLAYLFIESSRSKLTDADFEETVLSLGFPESLQQALSSFFMKKKGEIENILGNSLLKVSHYKDLDWRFDVQLASRSLHDHVTPLITLKLSLESEENIVKPVLLQTDPSNLIHMTQVLETALQESRSQHARKVQHSFRQ